MPTPSAHTPVRAGHGSALPEVDTARCTGCGRCVAVCGPHALSLETVHWRKSSVLHAPQSCTGCGRCVVICPFDAIQLSMPPDEWPR